MAQVKCSYTIQLHGQCITTIQQGLWSKKGDTDAIVNGIFVCLVVTRHEQRL